jgi:hypothetical protein
VRSLSLCAVGHAFKVRVREQIEFDGAFNEERRWYQAHLIDQLVAHDPAKGIDIELPARGEGARQFG